MMGGAPFMLGFVVISLLAAWAAASASCCLWAIPACSIEYWDDEYILPELCI